MGLPQRPLPIRAPRRMAQVASRNIVQQNVKSSPVQVKYVKRRVSKTVSRKNDVPRAWSASLSKSTNVALTSRSTRKIRRMSGLGNFQRSDRPIPKGGCNCGKRILRNYYAM